MFFLTTKGIDDGIFRKGANDVEVYNTNVVIVFLFDIIYISFHIFCTGAEGNEDCIGFFTVVLSE